MRIANRFLAALVALGLAVIGALIVVEVVAERLSEPHVMVNWPAIYRWAQRTSLTQGSVRVACIIMAALGVALVLAELKPRRPKRLPVATDTADTAYTRRGVAAAVGHAVDDVDGINRSSVRVRRRRIRVEATTAGLEPYTAQTLREPVEQAAQTRLSALELRKAPKLKIRLRTRRP